MKILGLLVGILLLVSCGVVTPRSEVLADYPLLAEHPVDSWLQVSVKDFIAEAPGEDYWKSPREFEKDFGGDCEDFAVDLLYHIGPEASLVLLRRRGDAPGSALHATVKWHGHLWEPQYFGLEYPLTNVWIVAEYPYIVALRAAIETHRRPQ